MSRSNIADDEEWTDVGDEGIEAGDLDPSRGAVCNSCDCRAERRCSRFESRGVAIFVFEVIRLSSDGGELCLEIEGETERVDCCCCSVVVEDIEGLTKIRE